MLTSTPRACRSLALLLALLCLTAHLADAHSVPRRQQAAARRRAKAAAAVAATGAALREDVITHMRDRFPDSKQGMLDCISPERTMPNWDSKEGLVCDPGVCNGTQQLQTMSKPSQLNERFSAKQLQTYVYDLYEPNKISGWMVPVHAWLVGTLSRYQRAKGMFGAVGEIGVFQGKLFTGLAGFSLPDEPLMAADWFDAFAKRGYFDKFQGNMQSYLGIAPSQISIYQGDTQYLMPKWFAERKIPFFRLMSVDASHDLREVLRDFNLAGCLIMDGGIIIADDFGGQSWMGVNSALYNFVFEQSRVVPFLMAANKLYLTTVSHQEEYYDMLSSLPNVRCKEKNEILTRVSVGDYRVCMLQHEYVDNSDVSALLRLLQSQTIASQ